MENREIPHRDEPELESNLEPEVHLLKNCTLANRYISAKTKTLSRKQQRALELALVQHLPF